MECGLAFIPPILLRILAIMWSEILDLLDVHYTCISNFHLWHTRVFCKNIWERSILLHSKILWKPTEPDHQTTSIDCPFPTPTVVARRLSCHCLARLPASLAVAAGGLRTGGGEPVPGSLLGSRGGAGYRGQRLVATWLFQRLDFGFCFSGFFKNLL